MQPSRRLRQVLAVLHGLALAGLLLAALPAWGRAVGAAAIVFSYWRVRRPQAALTLRCQADGSLTIGQGDAWQAVALQPGSLVWPWCCVLRLRGDDFRRVLTVLPDSLDGETFRRLRVWLRWRAGVTPKPGRNGPHPAVLASRDNT